MWKKIYPKLKKIHNAKQLLLAYAGGDSSDDEEDSASDGSDSDESVDCSPDVIKYLDERYLATFMNDYGGYMSEWMSLVLHDGEDRDPYLDDREGSDGDNLPSEPESI